MFGAGAGGRLANPTGAFKTSIAVLGGLTLAACTLVPLIDREEPEQPA